MRSHHHPHRLCTLKTHGPMSPEPKLLPIPATFRGKYLRKKRSVRESNKIQKKYSKHIFLFIFCCLHSSLDRNPKKTNIAWPEQKLTQAATRVQCSSSVFFPSQNASVYKYLVGSGVRYTSWNPRWKETWKNHPENPPTKKYAEMR